MNAVICGMNPSLIESSRRTAIGISINKALIPLVVSLPNSVLALINNNRQIISPLLLALSGLDYLQSIVIFPLLNC